MDTLEPKIMRYGSSDDVKSSATYFKKSNILFARRNWYLRRVAISDFDGICSGDIYVLKPIEGKIIKEFLPILMHSDEFFEKNMMYSAGSMSTRVKWSHLADIEFDIPPIPEQKKIFRLITQVDETITKMQDMQKDLEVYFQSKCSELVNEGVDSNGNIKKQMKNKWYIKKLKDIARIKRGASPRPIADPKYFGNGRGWIRIRDVSKSKKFLKKTKDYLSMEGEKCSVAVNPDDLIMSIAATLAKPIIIKIKACIHDGFVLFSNLSDSIDTEFLYYWIIANSENFLSQKGTQKNLNSDIVANTIFWHPEKPEQKKIVKSLNHIFDMTLYLDDKLLELKNLRNSVINSKLSNT